jgi:gamma-butyrobetaine dioxygenase
MSDTAIHTQAGLEAGQPLLSETGIHVPLASGPAYFNAYWLRDNCPSAADPETGEKSFDISESITGPRAASAVIDGDALVVTWAASAGEHGVCAEHTSRYALDWLEQWAARRNGATGHRNDPAALPRRLWEAGHYPNFVRVDRQDIETDPAVRARFARALIEDGIALVSGMENSDAGLTRLAETLGHVTPTADGYYFDVRLHIAPSNLAFTAKALEMHTDLPSEQLAPGVQFLHCRANSVEGGNSLFADGAAVAEAFRLSHPEDFALLAGYDIPFIRQLEGWDMRAHQRVIETDPDGAVSGLTISQHLSDTMDLPQDLLDRYYPAFCRFLRQLRDERFMNRFRLNAGECIVFDNHRVVHGREAFSADAGERHLRGGYVCRGALRSTFRVLHARGFDGQS